VDELVLALEAKPDHQASMDMLRQMGVLVAIYENPKDAASMTYVRADSLVDYMKTVWDQAERDTAYYLEQAAYHASESRHAVALAAAERAAEAAKAPHERAEAARVQALRSLGQ